ncbi:MAG: glycoside-pentoside-hexuronide (GPH):cation symporter [Clostridia bacterium]|nr:glycoside-pentoside-hexuronide (GPH):cation symporter [Clostridia bacterium]
MENKKTYLTFPKKLAYGTGDLGSNFFYMLISSFVLIYATDAIGMDAKIVGTLIMVSKLLDGVTDVFFGGLIDKTHSKMGKARPWMFYSGFPLALCLVLVFAIPTGMGSTAQYVWFFIFYTLSNAVFYTANNISYATLSALITKNDAERVSLGSFRYVFAVLASVIVSASAVAVANAMGGGAAGWRNMAIIFALVFLVFNSLSSLVSKEVVENDETSSVSTNENKESFWSLLKIVFTNKYYLLLLAIYLLMYTNTGLGTSIGVYYFQYIMGNASLLGVVSMSSMVMIVGLIFNPGLVKKFGMYKVNLISYIATTVISAISCIFVFSASLPGIIATAFIRAIAMAFLMGSLNALVAEVAQNNFLVNGVHTEGMMFSCSSIGMKVGGGLGAALAGWLLSAAGYVGTAATQTDSVNIMIKAIYGVAPLIITILITLCLAAMKVDDVNRKLEKGQN